MPTDTTLAPPPALANDAGSARYLTGHVVEADSEVCLVSVLECLHEAHRALSCLIAVQAGDRVAVLIEGNGKTHVLAVLERPEPGALRIATERNLSIETAGELSLRGTALSAVAQRTQMLVGKLRFIATDISAESRALKFVAQVAHTIVDSLHLVAQRSFRHIEQSDHQRCGYLDLEAEQLIQIRGRNTMITAHQLTRVDGAQIHVG